jgi:hypothetical protein
MKICGVWWMVGWLVLIGCFFGVVGCLGLCVGCCVVFWVFCLWVRGCVWGVGGVWGLCGLCRFYGMCEGGNDVCVFLVVGLWFLVVGLVC